MSRMVSFGVLVAIILVIGVLFFRVMASFLLPLFLSALLVVMFRPLHNRILEKCGGRERLSAGLTTASITLIVLLPVAGVIVLAGFEAQEFATTVQDTDYVARKIAGVRGFLHLNIPHRDELWAIEEGLQELSDAPSSGLLENLARYPRLVNHIQQLEARLKKDWESSGRDVAGDQHLSPLEKETDVRLKHVSQQKRLWEGFRTAFDRYGRNMTSPRNRDGQRRTSDAGDGSEPASMKKKSVAGAKPTADDEKKSKDVDKTEDETAPPLQQATTAFRAFRRELLGGQFSEWAKETANPRQEELDKWKQLALSRAQTWLLTVGGDAAAFVGRTGFGIVIMVVGVYFFLVDGPGMVRTVMRLSPLDDRHEQELIDEFDRISRAVVVATLLSAVVQGMLAGVGYAILGLDSVFLLTLLTMVLAMVPFVGAAAVWVPVCLWLLVEERHVATVVFGIYGAGIISMADNVIKPFVLHGQSNLHPLLALLSVLGGVQALGPIGIVVGPMVVAFLQTLLNILHKELMALDEDRESDEEEEDPDSS